MGASGLADLSPSLKSDAWQGRRRSQLLSDATGLRGNGDPPQLHTCVLIKSAGRADSE